MKICSWRFFHEDLFLKIFPLKFWKFLLKICSLGIFPLEYGFGDFSFEKWRIFLLKMEIFFMITKWRRWRWTRNDEDLLMGFCDGKYGFVFHTKHIAEATNMDLFHSWLITCIMWFSEFENKITYLGAVKFKTKD